MSASQSSGAGSNRAEAALQQRGMQDASQSDVGEAPRGCALVAGALGLVGAHLLAALREAGWRTVGIARGAQPMATMPVPGHRHLQLDLLDAASCRAQLTPLTAELTNVYFAARISDADPLKETHINLAMLVNLLDALDCPGSALSHLCLVHGTKWYGSHLGPYPTPAREDDPRCISPVFYYAQHDEMRRRQEGRSWTWSTVRPHIVLGMGTQYPYNCLTLLGTYGTLCRAMRVPFSFPGSRAAFDSVSQATDADLLARAMIWSATTPRAANQDYNVINGDYFRWSSLWPSLAEFFGLSCGPVRPMSLARELAGTDALWDRLVTDHGLRPLKLRQLANWQFGDFVFASHWDDMSSTVKLREHGFHETVATETSLLRHLTKMRVARLIP